MGWKLTNFMLTPMYEILLTHRLTTNEIHSKSSVIKKYKSQLSGLFGNDKDESDIVFKFFKENN